MKNQRLTKKDIQELRCALGWLKCALECENFRWNGDQKWAANENLNYCTEIIGKLGDEFKK